MTRKARAIAAAACALVEVRAGQASPPACERGDPARLVASDGVFVAQAIEGSVSKSGDDLRLEARYRITGVIKGILKPGQRIRVVASCQDRPVPRDEMGYPAVERYCRGGKPTTAGVDEKGQLEPQPTGGWVLFLALNRGDRTWKEVARTGYGDCSVAAERLTDRDREALLRLREWQAGAR